MNKYFAQREERLVKEYLATQDEEFYKKNIHSLLVKIADGVVRGKDFQPRRYFRSQAIITSCVSHLWETLINNYDPNRDKKAFSYLTSVAFNYFCAIHRNRLKTQEVLYKVYLEAGQRWNDSHAAIMSAEDMHISIENLQDKKEKIKSILVGSFDLSDEQYGKILHSLDVSQKSHKKNTLSILRNHINAPKKIMKAKNSDSHHKWMMRKVAKNLAEVRDENNT